MLIFVRKFLIVLISVCALTSAAYAATHEDILKPLWSEAETLKDQGRYPEAVAACEKLVAALEKQHGPEHAETLRGKTLLAQVYWESGNGNKAKELLIPTLNALERVLGKEHPYTLWALDNLAGAYYSLGDHAKAVKLQTQALEMKGRILGKEHQDTLASMNNLAFVYSSLGESAQAIKLHSQVLETRERILGKEHPDTLTSMNNLAQAYYSLGDYTQAVKLYTQVLETRERILGKEHPDTLTSMNNLARAYMALDNYAQAVKLYTQTLEMRERILGKEHPDTLTSLGNLANAYYSLDDYAQAVKLHTQTLETRERILGKEHLDTLTSMNNLASAYMALGDYAQAVKLYTQVLEMQKRILGKEHPDTLTLMNNLASAYKDLGDYAQAVILYTQLLEMRERILGKEHLDTLSAMNNLALTYSELGDHDNSQKLFEQILEYKNNNITNENYNVRNKLISIVMHNLSNNYRMKGDYDKAHEIYSQVLSFQEEKFGNEHSNTLFTKHNGILIYLGMNNYVEAKELCFKVLEGRVRLYGDEHPLTLSTRRLLVTIYKQLADNVKAKYFGQQLLVSYFRVQGKNHPNSIKYLFEFCNALNTKTETIFYSKLSVEGTQHFRGNLATLSKELRQSYLKSVENRYHSLVQMLMDDGRPEEAQEVLRLLKADELEDSAQGGKTEAKAISIFYGPERELRDEFFKRADAMRGPYLELEPLLKKREKEALSPEEQTRADGLQKRIDAATDEFRAFTESIRPRLEAGRAAVLADPGRLKNIGELRAIMNKLGKGAAIVHTVSCEDKLYLFLTTPGIFKLYPVAVSSKDLKTLAAQFSALLTSPARDPRETAQKLYEYVIAPMRNDLDAAKISTIMFSLDGSLRYVPMAALYDGRQWLTEQYDIAMFTEAARDRLTADIPQKVSISALGLSEARSGFNPLPAVKAELEDIAREKTGDRGVLPGIRRINDEFNYNALSRSMKSGVPVLHIASHFQFEPNAPSQSFLLLGDGSKLTLFNFNTDANLPFAGIDQLTLSACETAAGLDRGDGREVEGFGALAQLKGAKSVIATLWPISDASTGILMREFYRQRFVEKQTRAHALRIAQTLFVNDSKNDRKGVAAAPDYTETRGKAVRKNADGVQAAGAWTGTGYSHPYYWAPFILMGNWK